MATEVDGATDCRVTYIEDRFNVIFAREKLQSFLDGAGPDAMSLLSEKLPNGKRVALIKVTSGAVSNVGVSDQIMSMELGNETPLEHLESMAREIFLPLLSNPANQSKWGEVPACEIMDKFYSFLSSTAIINGHLKGETRLPMPPINHGSDSQDKNPISILEGATITWTKQIKSVLKQDPENQNKWGVNPTPDSEIKYWNTRAANINSIYDQLQGDHIKTVLIALDQSKSTYCTTFARLCKEVFTARLEANDNVKHLRTLEGLFRRLDGGEFFQLQELFKPIFHVILLVWKHSKYYNSPTRLVLLIRKICNSIIIRASKFSDSENLFALAEQGQAAKAVEQLQTMIRVCNSFKKSYFSYKAIAEVECPENPWRSHNNALFIRLDSFLERCHDILDMVQNVVLYSKLSKIEVGGTKGNTLTASVRQISFEFELAIDKFKHAPYDIMDVSAKKFDDDLQDMCVTMKELEQHLGAAVSLAFDDCSTVCGRFQLLDSFEGLLERPLIQNMLEKKYICLIRDYEKDIKSVKKLFTTYCGVPPVGHNLPPIAGALTWCRGLVERIKVPMNKLQRCDQSILERNETKEVAKLYASSMARLTEYESQKMEEWGREVETSSQAKLMLPLLVRNAETLYLTVNFDPALTNLLREVKYFLLLHLEVPESALRIYQQVETFRRWTGNLELVVNIYNGVLKQLLPVEKPLVQSYLHKFDQVIAQGIEELSWKNEGIEAFIDETMQTVKMLKEVMRTMKTNLGNMSAVIQSWNSTIMEKKLKPVDVDEFERMHKQSMASRCAMVKEGGKEIYLMLKDTNKMLKCSNISLMWLSYVGFINRRVMGGLCSLVRHCLDNLYQQIKGKPLKGGNNDLSSPVASLPGEGPMPIVEVKMELINHEVHFVPEIGFESDGKGIRDIAHNWVSRIFQFASLFKRLDQDGSYIRDIHADIRVKMHVAMLNDALNETQVAQENLRDKLSRFDYLWKTPMDHFFSEFKAEALVDMESGHLFIDIHKFEEAMKKYEELKDEVSQMSSYEDVGWIRVNLTPIKQGLHSWTTKWGNLFKEHLQETLVSTLEEIETFMVDMGKELNQNIDVQEGGEEQNGEVESKVIIMSLLKTIAKIRWAADTTTEKFQPLLQIVGVLKQHGVDVSSMFVASKKVQDYLEELPMAWDAFTRKTLQKKEEILPFQLAQADSLKSELECFQIRISEFRKKFRSEAPFSFNGPVEEAYSSLNAQAAKLYAMESQVKGFNELEDLFELQISKYGAIKSTREELVHLKYLWDFKSFLKCTFNSWWKIPWSELDMDSLENESKAILKQLRQIGNENPVTKTWQVYRDIEGNINDTATVLSLLNDLHSPAIRERHWCTLAKVCGVATVDPTTGSFNLGNIMKLNLHEHVEDVSDIIETAQREIKIEKKLQVIETTWDGMVLDYVTHKDTEMFVVRPCEELLEALESQQMELQGIVGMGKFVEFFKEQVNHWQRTLSNVEETLRLWTLVSRSWASLESIFLASADIRAQLPDDTKRFESIDGMFKELMKVAIETPSPVEACNVEGRIELLNNLSHQLEICQKSLNDYLDMKKKIFPRFYFVSNVALLDMLANGTNPPKLMPYIGDCYDSLSKLIFVKDKEGNESTKVVDCMISKDGEQIVLAEPFTMEGEVEAYLNKLTDAMVNTLKHELNNGIQSAVNWDVDKPRHQWLFDYPAQVVLTATQVYWTEETEAVLEEYEAGQEDGVKQYLGVCNRRLNSLIELVLGDLTQSDRTKIISLVTLDVHARDVVQKLVSEKTEGPGSFLWQQQLRFYWDQNGLDVDIRITDFQCKYFYEWIGNTGRLVITPLTDRCYITLTMGLRLFLGGAPAGPAGTGKTETTKDLARALALPCYVFNCSDQMNYQTMADIFRGLAQTGAWGCFDEFNRIPIEVLSVVATQVKTVQDAIIHFSVPLNRNPEFQNKPSGTPPCKVGTFDFCGDAISLIPTCGFFITMNPGYAGRTELPENLKALFRSCAMIRPDLKPICENMLMSEGFQTARDLAIKFVTLYELSGDLLSKQFHYDWGLRAVKSVLRVAGMLKRGEPQLDEGQILMRALRDFNTPKIPHHDTPIFLRLIADLFVGLDVPVKQDQALKDMCTRSALEEGLQADDMFLNRTVQFQELLDVRHSVMLLGPAGCGKTTIWKTLAAAHNLDKPKKTCVYETVNPKAVSGDELYGYMTLSKDWKDGVLSILMRAMSKNSSEEGFYDFQTKKWVVLDGDIDAVWIESMNTVMDDNKVLTLVSNERVPLSDSMRMVFEISSLKNATPATVSRAGILYINESDIGWRPFVDSWIAQREDKMEQAQLPLLFSKYIDVTQKLVSKGYKEVTTLRVLNKICTIVYLLEGLLKDLGDKRSVETMENMFVFAVCWAFGGPMVCDKSGDYRAKFSEEFKALFPLAKSQIPKDGTCFDYFFDPHTGTFIDWDIKVPSYAPVQIGGGVGETPFSRICVATSDTVRLSTFMDLLVKQGRFMMLAGTAGTGKTMIANKYLAGLNKDTDGILSSNINMNYYTDSSALQMELELQVEKRNGRRFGPPATKRMVYFIDDLNLPYIETYGTQNAIALLTQLISYGTIFDRTDLGFRKEIVDVQFLAAFNPTAGSFHICERLQRHFATFCVSMPSDSDLQLIFGSILAGHLQSFPTSIQDSSESIVDASISLLRLVSQKFLPSAVKFTYNWNMRELSNIFQGLLCALPTEITTPAYFSRLWLHKTERVYRDRILSEPEMEIFDGLVREVTAKYLSGIEGNDELFTKPLIFTSFVDGTGDCNKYAQVSNVDELKVRLDQKLHEYNEQYPMMDLVLFEQAMEHVTRIARILKRPSGNALLIGVGGSGKQSLSRLSAFICDYVPKQLSVTGNFSVADFKEVIVEMFNLAGVKGVPIMFLMTDGQIVNDRYLIYINSILANGWINDLFTKEEVDGLLGSLRNEAKQTGVPDEPLAILDFLIRRIKANLHIVLCFSPVGDVFRIRARRFPGLINCTSIDYFHPWPRDALVSVASRFLEKIDLKSDEIKQNIALHMMEEHMTVSSCSVEYYESKRRYNYVTPKSYLELIGFFKFILDQKRTEVQWKIDRLDVGLSTLRKTASDVAELQADLKKTMVKVEEKKAATDALLAKMKVQKADAEKQQELANIEAEKAATASTEASAIEKEAEGELAEAEPAMKAAAEAVDCLSKTMLTELKSLAKPPAGVDKVTKVVLLLVEKETKNHSWDRAKKMIMNVDAFKRSLQTFRGEDITEQEILKIEPIIKDPSFTVENMKTKSAAAANLATWAISVYTYNRIYVKVKPLMDSLEAARISKAEADASLEASNQAVAEIESELKQLENKLAKATEEKAVVEAEATACQDRLGLAERLVGGLSSEYERWGTEIEKLRHGATTLVGDCMLASGFVSYVGAFDQNIRDKLWKEVWLPDLKAKNVPLTEGVDPLHLLTDDGKNAKMISEGLPADRISIENGSIIINCQRWPLLIDPQDQGVKWLRKREEENGLMVIQLTQRNWLHNVISAITNGQSLIIENLGEEIDPTLEPILSRSIYKKGRTLYLSVGGDEVEYDPGFRLFLQTKLSNPHYKPEVAAQCTIINFIATEKGLEDQLLAKVVGVERPELEKRSQELQNAFNQYKIQLAQLENDLLERLSNAPDDILSDVPLIEGLETTKATAKEITEAVERGKETEVAINKAREQYRKQATEGAMFYFLLTRLCTIDRMYQYSLDSYFTVFLKSITKAEAADDVEQRVSNLCETLRLTIYSWISKGLFERHKLILLAQLTFNLMKRGILGEDNVINEAQFKYLMRGPRVTGDKSPLSWLPDTAWQGCRALSEIEEFTKLPTDIVEASPRFREWCNHITPENEKLPLDWSALDRTPFQKMLVVRCLRPDRMKSTLSQFVRNTLPNGSAYVDCDLASNSFQILEDCFQDCTTTTHIYFILSPGANVVGDLDQLAEKNGFVKNVSYHNVSMGQGQDMVAMSSLESAHRNGHWVILNNIHLMPRWLEELEKKLDEFGVEGSHPNFRLFLSSEPSKGIPIGLLSRCIKVTTEPPTGLKANVKRAFASFTPEYIEEADSKFKYILFGLCHFHAVVMERKLYGPMGFNMQYPFSVGDLRDSSICLSNYMENNAGGKTPWQDLKYIFGEIVYGGHIVNDFDRLLANTYLDWYMKDELLDETEMYPFVENDAGVSYMSPNPTSYSKYLEHIDSGIKSDTPLAFGFHPNAEIGFRTTQSDVMFQTMMELQLGNTDEEGESTSPEQVVSASAEFILENFSTKKFETAEILQSIDDVGPYQNVFIQEMDIMNVLLGEVTRSLKELQLGFAGELTMSDAMEGLKGMIYMDQVPDTWMKRAWASQRSLGSWLQDFTARLHQLEEWQNNPNDIPQVTWISGLVNPQSFLTAICQDTARRSSTELDKLSTLTEVTKKTDIQEVGSHSKDGAYIVGLSMQGARWDVPTSKIENSRPKEMFSAMPVINVRGVNSSRLDNQGVYMCPVYKTEQRGPTYVFSAQLKTKAPPARWILAGVALLLDVV